MEAATRFVEWNVGHFGRWGSAAMFASPLAFVMPPFEAIISGIVFAAVSLSGAAVILISKRAEAMRTIAVNKAQSEAEIRVIQARAAAEIRVIQHRAEADGKG